MPFTGSHPAAILPLKRWCSQSPYFLALVIGSMSPDFGYFSPIDVNTRYSHTFEGALMMDLPISVLALVGVLMVRKSFCQLLPNPHRDFLLGLCVKPNFSWKMIFITLLCLWFGTLTHVGWDGFTHASSLLVRKNIWLQQEPWLDMPIYRVIQHTSTLVGGLILLLAYRKTLHKNNYFLWPIHFSKEWKRYCLWISLGMLSLTIGFIKNYFRLESAKEFYDYQVYAFHFVVSSLAVYFCMIVVLWLCGFHSHFKSWINRSKL